MSSPLLPFLGGRRNQAAEIVAALHYYAGGNGTFCDPFFGGGSISLEAKRRGFSVRSNDLAKRSYIPARALIANDESLPADVSRRLIEPVVGEHDFVGHKIESAIEFDILHFGRRLWHNSTNDTERYLAMRVFMDLVPMGGFGLIKKTDSSAASKLAYERALRLLADPLSLIDRSRKAINEGILSNGRPHVASQLDAVAHIHACVQAGALVVCLDPPTYGNKKYRNYYWWLDWFVGDVVEEEGLGFTQKEAVAFSRACIQAAADAPVLGVMQKEVAYDRKTLFSLMEEADRRTVGFQLVSNTKAPLNLVLGFRKDWHNGPA